MAKYTRFAKVYEECFPTLPNELIDIIHSFAPIMGSFLTDIQKVNKVYSYELRQNEGKVMEWSYYLYTNKKVTEKYVEDMIDVSFIMEYFATTNIGSIRCDSNRQNSDTQVTRYNRVYPNKNRVTYAVFTEKDKPFKIDLDKDMLVKMIINYAGRDEFFQMLTKPKLIQMLLKISKRKFVDILDLTQPQLVYLMRYSLMKF